LDEGIAGKLVNVGAASAVADAVSSLCDDPDARRKIAGSGYRRVNEHFLLDQVARKYLEIFDQIMLASKNILLVRPC
jgi:glycosyltransferase involved in cell wall biosynthesis